MILAYVQRYQLQPASSGMIVGKSALNSLADRWRYQEERIDKSPAEFRLQMTGSKLKHSLDIDKTITKVILIPSKCINF
jgi:hypothetical protein